MVDQKGEDRDRKIQEELEATSERFKIIFDNAPIGLSVWGSETYKCYEINQKTLDIFHRSKKEMLEQSWSSFTHPEDIGENEEMLRKLVTREIDSFTLEKRFVKPDGGTVWARLTDAFFGYSREGDHLHIAMIEDITESRQAQEKLRTMSYQDQLTGLGNRRCFEEAFSFLDRPENLPLTLIVADINGLKLTNDTFGHEAGDRLLKSVASVFQKELGSKGTVARIGGDEFAALMPCLDKKENDCLVKTLKKEIKGKKIDEMIECSVSVGLKRKKEAKEDLRDIFKQAEYRMYRNKLSESKKMREHTIREIIRKLNDSNPREKKHVKRVADICEGLGKSMDLSFRELQDLKTAALLHDIGKIAISSEILDKKGKLTAREYTEVKKHPETGYQLLRNSIEFGSVAEVVLLHHERIDGKGYPMHIKGEEIPRDAKIISIVDAYDAMTGVRPYKKIMTKKEAIEELRRNEGSQFDSTLAELFIAYISEVD